MERIASELESANKGSLGQLLQVVRDLMACNMHMLAVDMGRACYSHFATREERYSFLEAILPALGPEKEAAIELLLRQPWPNLRRQPTLFALAHQSLTMITGVARRISGPGFKIKDTEERWRWTNPYIMRQGSELVVVLRGVNYIQEKARKYVSLSPDGVFRTRNQVITLSLEHECRSIVGIRDLSGHARAPFSVRGLEDVRLVSFRGRDYLVGQSRNLDETSIVRMFIALFDRKKGEIGRMVVFEPPVVGRHEKNWLPDFAHLRFFYAYDPLTVAELSWPEEEELPAPKITLKVLGAIDPRGREMRGSGGPVPFTLEKEAGYLLALHGTVDLPSGRKYHNRFLWLPSDYNPTKGRFSRAWTFFGSDVEFCHSLDVGEDDVLDIGVGVEDAEAWHFRVASDCIAALFRPHRD